MSLVDEENCKLPEQEPDISPNWRDEPLPEGEDVAPSRQIMRIGNSTVQTSPTTAKIDQALAKAQRAMPPIKCDSVNSFFDDAPYASLAAIWEACREPLGANGIAVHQGGAGFRGNGWVGLTTTLRHEGEWIASTDWACAVQTIKDRASRQVTKEIPLVNAQASASCNTYLKRRGLSGAIGVAAHKEDTDAEGALGRETKHKPVKASKPTGKPKPAPPKPAAPKSISAEAFGALPAAEKYDVRRGQITTNRKDPKALEKIANNLLSDGHDDRGEETLLGLIFTSLSLEQRINVRGHQIDAHAKSAEWLDECCGVQLTVDGFSEEARKKLTDRAAEHLVHITDKKEA